jgi:ribosomal protein S6
MDKNIENGADGTELELEAGYNESRVYELGFHIDPELPETEVRKTYQSIREQIASAGTIVAEGEPVHVQLAYTISRQSPGGRRDFNSAFFSWIAYEATGEGHEAVATMARTETRIVRFLDLRTSVDAAKHSAEMSEIYARAAAEEAQGGESESEVSDVELDAALKEAGV